MSSPALDEPRKCWICLATEIEDTPTTSTWRTPCPCALTAHERCLLDWIAQVDEPLHQPGRRRKIECPQCKAEIAVARPRSYIVETILAVESACGRLVLPVIVITVAGGVLAGCWLHGLTTVFLVFGRKDAHDIVGLHMNSDISSSVHLGLPLIPVLLIASRTTLADRVLRVLPVFLLYSQLPTWTTSHFWPPSAAVAFAALPYLRSAYNAFYVHFVAPRKKAWIRALEPRGGDDDEGTGNENNLAPEQHAGDVHAGLLEIGIEVQIIADEDVPNQPPAAAPPPAPPAPGNPPPVEAQAAPRELRHLDIVGSSSGLANKVVGALLFPALSAGMGELLKLALPYAWRTPPQLWERRSAGLLQTRWGRSIVGGCLIVLMKDTAVLYTRHRLAKMQRERTVLDWPGRRTREGVKA